MIIYCMSDIHGCLAEFEDALSLVLDDIEQGKAKLVLLGDYIHGGPDNRGVLDRIMRLRERFGSDRIIALLGNHDEWVVNGSSTISNNSVYARIAGVLLCGIASGFDLVDTDCNVKARVGSLPFRCIMWRKTRFSFTPVLMKKRVICGNGKHQKMYSPQNIPLKPAKSRGLI